MKKNDSMAKYRHNCTVASAMVTSRQCLAHVFVNKKRKQAVKPKYKTWQV